MRRLPLALLSLLLLPAAAQADTYCVGKPDCAGTNLASLSSAAATVNQHSGPDRVEIGAGTFTGPDGGFTPGVEIVGAGRNATFVKDGKATQAFNLSGTKDSLSGLTLRLNPANAVGVDLSGGTVSDLTIESDQPDNGSQGGVILRNGGTVRNVKVAFNREASPVNYGVTATYNNAGPVGQAIIEDVDLTAGYALSVSQYKGTVAINRARLHGGVFALSTRGDAQVTGSDILAKTDGGWNGGGGVHVSDSYATKPISVELSHSTFVCDLVNGTALEARADAGGSIAVKLRDVVLDASANAYARSIDLYGNSVAADVAFSALSGGRIGDNGKQNGVLTLGAGNQDLDRAPLGLSADGVPQAGSVLIDHGSEAGGIDGDSDGVAVRDIGAVEAPANTSPAPAPGAALTGPGPATQPTPVPTTTPTVTPGPGAVAPVGSRIRRASRKVVVGTAETGTRSVLVSVIRRRGTRCAAMTKTGAFARIKCGRRRFALTAKGTTEWSLKLPKTLRKGRYTITSQARRGTQAESEFSERHGNVRVLRVA